MVVALTLPMLPAMPAGAIGTQVVLTTGTSWTVPAGVTNISIECWGGGGGGGNRTTLNGRGGGGGAYAKVNSYAVTPGAVIPISIGAGGGSAANGGNTTFNTNICVAAGGSAGVTNGAGGTGGLASASTGDITANGGSGAQNGGGGSAGVTALGLTSATAIAGNNASVCTGGTAVANGGAGGSGNCANQSIGGGAGGFPGGGGGGGSKGGGGPAILYGGAGAQGRIIITYLPEITTPTVTGIGTTSATLGANFVNANGATTVSERGICWGTTPAPTTNCTSSGTATGVYTQLVSGFTAGTLYYYRGYITVESGTGYSEDGTFTTDTTLAVTGPSSIISPVTTGTLTASGGSSGGTVSFNYVSGGCSLGGADNATLTVTDFSNSPCVVTATRAAGGNFVAQTSANYNVTLVDNTAPTLLSFTRQNPLTSPTNADVLVFRATFDEDVQNVDAADFAVTGTTAAVTLVTPVSASVYDITVSGGDLAGLNGTVGLDLAVGQNISDLAGNALPPGEPATDETYLLDNIAPTVTVEQASGQSDPTNVGPILFTVTFSEPINTSTFTAADVVLSASTAPGPLSASIIEIAPNNGTTFEVSVSGMSGNGDVIVSIAANTVQDPAGNNNAASTSTDNTVTYDIDALTVTVEQAATQADPTNVGPILFTVTFNKPINTSTFTATDVVLSASTASGPLSASIIEIAPNDGTTFEVSVSGMSGSGDVIVSIAGNTMQDPAGNDNAASTSIDNTVTYDINALTVTVEQASGQSDPTNVGPILFTVTFNKPINTSTFTAADVVLSASTTPGPLSASITEIAPNDGTTFQVSVSGMSGNGDVIVSIAANTVQDLASNNNASSTSTDNTVTFDNINPIVASTDLLPEYTGSGPQVFTVTFNKPVSDPVGNTDPDDATNTANYLLVSKGPNGAADTASCASPLQGDDTQVALSSVSYDAATYKSLVTLFNNLPLGSYRLFVCGTTSIVDLAGNPLNGGSDYTFDFTVQPVASAAARSASSLPATGFAPGRITRLPIQPVEKAYSQSDLWLEIPRLGVKMDIVGVPQVDGEWDVSWLGNQAGWLEGSAFPTWEGNSVITGHVWNANNTAGLFRYIGSLKWGDQVIVHAWGAKYIYEVRSVSLVNPSNASAMLKHEKLPWVTLVTCTGYDTRTGQYRYRTLVRAVLVSIK